MLNICLKKNSRLTLTLFTRQPRERNLSLFGNTAKQTVVLISAILQNYIKEKVHQTLNLNINLPQEELIAAAKMSVGKDRTYWMDLSHKGASEIFNLEKELLPFLHEPTAYAKEKYDEQLRKTFFCKVSDHLNRKYITKPPETLAKEVVTPMLDGLIHGDCDPLLFRVYCTWLDSELLHGLFTSVMSELKRRPNATINAMQRYIEALSWKLLITASTSERQQRIVIITKLAHGNRFAKE